MILVLKGADFSANNIGQIDIPYEYSAFTLAALEASGNESLTEEQKIAIDVFFNTVGATDNSGVFAKLHKLYIPVIGGNVAKALLNFKNNNVDAVLGTEGFVYDNGIKGNGTATNSIAVVDASYNLDMTNASFAIKARCSSDIQYSNGFVFIAAASNSDANFRGLNINRAGRTGGYQMLAYDTNNRSKVVIDTMYNHLADQHARVISLNEQNLLRVESTGITTGTTTFVSNSQNKGVRMFVGGLNATNSSGVYPSISFLALGTALTQDEATLFYNAIESLLSKFA